MQPLSAPTPLRATNSRITSPRLVRIPRLSAARRAPPSPSRCSRKACLHFLSICDAVSREARRTQTRWPLPRGSELALVGVLRGLRARVRGSRKTCGRSSGKRKRGGSLFLSFQVGKSRLESPPVSNHSVNGWTTPATHRRTGRHPGERRKSSRGRSLRSSTALRGTINVRAGLCCISVKMSARLHVNSIQPCHLKVVNE
ncbi:hypothetical protein C8Q79DRAFT_349478 [Trametes meyenii]|nr:hypothetical protein C8Q79DRAFT_349478 [Trametes meyenii]